MKILLLVPVPPRTVWPNGYYRVWAFDTRMACAATVLLRAGHEVRILRREEQLIKLEFDWDQAEVELRHVISNFRPDMVAQSVVTPAMPEASRIASLVKEIVGPQAINVLCGTHPSGMPDLVLSESPHADAVALGEYEMTLGDVAEKGLGPDVPGLVLRQNGGVMQTPQRSVLQDVDSLGLPAWDLLDMKFQSQRNPWMIRYLNLSSINIRTSRGCPNRCIYCAEHLVSGVGVRFHSLDYVMKQVSYACEQLGVEAVHFEDETLGADRERLMAICEAVQQRGFHKRLKWDCLMRVDQVDAELLAAMKAAGCIQIEYGFESGSDSALRRVGKNATVDQNRKAVSLTKAAGIRIFANIMVGLPGESQEDLKATERFLRWAKPDILSAGRLLPMPGTALYKRLPESVRAVLPWEGYCYTSQPGFQINFTEIPDAEFERWYRGFYKYVINPHNTLAQMRDRGQSDERAIRNYQHYLYLFIRQHPIRAFHLPMACLKSGRGLSPG